MAYYELKNRWSLRSVPSENPLYFIIINIGPYDYLINPLERENKTVALFITHVIHWQMGCGEHAINWYRVNG